MTAKKVGLSIVKVEPVQDAVVAIGMVLPWEDQDGYRKLLEEMRADHDPQGATESHLVEELAGIIWRKRRLALAELACFHMGLHKAVEEDGFNKDKVVRRALVHLDEPAEQLERPVVAVRATAQETETERAELAADQALTEKAIKILQASKAGVYDRALKAVREDTRTWWADALEGEYDDEDEEGETVSQWTPDATSLRKWLETSVMDWYASRIKELDNRPLIRAQAIGEAFYPHQLDRLARYEIHLDRKFEKTLAMLLKLKDLREK